MATVQEQVDVFIEKVQGLSVRATQHAADECMAREEDEVRKQFTRGDHLLIPEDKIDEHLGNARKEYDAGLRRDFIPLEAEHPLLREELDREIAAWETPKSLADHHPRGSQNH